MKKRWILVMCLSLMLVVSGCQKASNKEDDPDTIGDKAQESDQEVTNSDENTDDSSNTPEETVSSDEESNEGKSEDEGADKALSYEVYQDESSALYGYQSSTGEKEEAIYLEATAFIDGYATVKESEEKTYVIDMAFNKILENQSNIINYGYGYFGLVTDFAYNLEDYRRVRLMDEQGNDILGRDVFEVDVYNENLLLVADHVNGWLVDGKGRVVGSKETKAFQGYSKAEVVDGNFLLYREEGDQNYYKKVDAFGVVIDLNEPEEQPVVLGDGITVTSYVPFFGRFEKVALPKINDSNGIFDEANDYFGTLYTAQSYIDTPVEDIYGTKDISYSVDRIGDVIEIQVVYSDYGFGAAHPNYYAETYQLSSNFGYPYGLSDLLDFTSSEDVFDTLTKMVQEKAKEDEENYYEISEITVDDNSNFSVSQEGITIYYQPYEIGPYAMGAPEFSFTWEELGDIVDMSSEFYNAIIAQ